MCQFLSYICVIFFFFFFLHSDNELNSYLTHISCTQQAWVAIAQSVWRLATGWTVRGSNPGGGRDFPHLSRPTLGSTQPPVQWVRVFPGGKERPGRDADPSASSSAVVKKEQSYTSTPPMGRTACTEPQGLYEGAICPFYHIVGGIFFCGATKPWCVMPLKESYVYWTVHHLDS